MAFNLYLELGTRVQDSPVLDLVRIPPDSVLPESASWTAKWWSRGKTSTASSPRERTLSRLSTEGFNELELEMTERSPGAGSHVRAASLLLHPSFSSVLWAPVPGQKLSDRQEERNRLSFGGGGIRAGPLKHYKLPYPNIVECSLEIEETNFGSDERGLQTAAVSLIRDSILPLLRPRDVFGYGCVHGQCRTQMMLHSLGGIPEWIDQLGSKFENIYPILIGDRSLCERLHTSIADCELLLGEEAAPAIISIPPDRVPEIRQRPETHEFVVIRDIGKLDVRPAVADAVYQSISSMPWVAPFVRR